ncbi:MAG: hypothetical protein FWF54_07520 [Candidatus Azobacteroides sp.]|nr:hypothetical protein [Candidatus Azobacteroides sp.]
MKAEIQKTKNFNIASFETVDSKGNTLLKGGFSTAYDDNLASGGLVINIYQCGCTVAKNK